MLPLLRAQFVRKRGDSGPLATTVTSKTTRNFPPRMLVSLARTPVVVGRFVLHPFLDAPSRNVKNCSADGHSVETAKIRQIKFVIKIKNMENSFERKGIYGTTVDES